MILKVAREQQQKLGTTVLGIPNMLHLVTLRTHVCLESRQLQGLQKLFIKGPRVETV